jgi:hypothetical protein
MQQRQQCLSVRNKLAIGDVKNANDLIALNPDIR